ncbi:MAG: type II and III secretion system protein family protein [Parcubacteria group bacterium]
MKKTKAVTGPIHKTAALICGMLLASALLLPADAAGQQREELVVPAGQSEVLDVGSTYTDLMIANPDVADVLPLSNHSIYVVGKKTGSTSLSVYGPGKRLLSVAMITVSANVSGLKQRLYEILPDERNIAVHAAGESVVLSGPVSSGPRLQQALALAETYAPGKVVNMMSVQGTQQVMLSVRFVEVDRNVAKDLRLNVESADLHNEGFDPRRPFIATGETILSKSLLDSFGLGQLRFRYQDLDLDVLFDALEKKGVAKTIANPTLVAMSGDTASFLAGGEFPVPVAQSSGSNASSGNGGSSASAVAQSTITVEFKQFGVALAFTPTVLDDGKINLVVAPEVSDIDPTVSFISQGLVIPGLKVRRAKTTVELRDGESFTIAGLLRDDYENAIRQYPFVGDLPVLGALFRSTGYQKHQTELVMVVTPHLAVPTQTAQAMPGGEYVPPSDFELFLFGATQGLKSGVNPEDRALMGMDPSKVGVDGKYGHVLF